MQHSESSAIERNVSVSSKLDTSAFFLLDGGESPPRLIARRGEPGYRDKLTNVMNSMYERDKKGRLILTTSAPMFEEVRQRTDKAWMSQFHEGSIARVCVFCLTHNTRTHTYTHKHVTQHSIPY